MNRPHEVWMAHTISHIGLTIEVFANWPLLSMSDVGAEGIYQEIADTGGILFVRYGPHDTVAEYVGQLGGMFAQVSVLSDAQGIVAGRAARSVTLTMVAASREIYREDADEGITHRQAPETRTRVCVIGFSHRGIPILAGYRIPEQSLEQYRKRLENTLQSIFLT
jgi:hypothetical protein